MRISRSPASNFWAKQGPQRPEPKQLQTIEGKVSLKTSSIWLVTCPTQIVAKTGNKTHEDIGTFSAVKASFAHFYHAASKHLYYVFKIIRSFSKHQQKTSRGRWFCCSILQHSKAVHCLCPMSRKKSIKKKHQLFCLSLANYSSFKFQDHFPWNTPSWHVLTTCRGTGAP